jgi:Zn-dependent protease with chaperone function
MSSSRNGPLLSVSRHAVAIALMLAAPGLSSQQVADAPEAEDEETMVVGETGLALYPRWSKAFPPLAKLSPGETLQLLRDSGTWKHVQVMLDPRKGWVYCETAPPAAGAKLDLPIAASPTTSGLVVKGFSPRHYALRSGVDDGAVQALMARPLDFERFAQFLAEDPVPVLGPNREPAPVSAALPTDTFADAKKAAMAARADRMSRASSASERLAALTGKAGKTVQGLEATKAGLAGRSALEGDLPGLLGEAGASTLGQGVAARILAETPELDDAALGEYVRFVGLRLADHVPGPSRDWWFAVLDSGQVNAWSTAGGFVFVTAAAVRACENEAQLAALLAHELAHVAYGHALASLGASSDRLIVEAARAALDDQLPEGDLRLVALVEDLEGLGDSLLAQTRNSFGHVLEHEADGLSLRILQGAGYDPHEAVRALTRIAASPDLGRGRRLGSHPDPQERVLVMRSVLAEERMASEGSRNEARFRRHVPTPGR